MTTNVIQTLEQSRTPRRYMLARIEDRYRLRVFAYLNWLDHSGDLTEILCETDPAEPDVAHVRIRTRRRLTVREVAGLSRRIRGFCDCLAMQDTAAI